MTGLIPPPMDVRLELLDKFNILGILPGLIGAPATKINDK